MFILSEERIMPRSAAPLGSEDYASVIKTCHIPETQVRAYLHIPGLVACHPLHVDTTLLLGGVIDMPWCPVKVTME